MSFQDFSNKTKRKPAGAVSAGVPQVTPTLSSGDSTATAGSTAAGADGLRQISESLLQYQRNVGILEKIVHSLTASAASGGRAVLNASELNMQYSAQVDVIGQLQDKVQKLLQQQASVLRKQQQQTGSSGGGSPQKTALTKLERDFDRVRQRASQLQEAVNRQRKQQEAAAKAAAAAQSQDEAARAASDDAADYYQQMQLQLQQDRMNEEIMREREEEIRNINRGMHQVNEIYKDLAHIVGSQQEQVDQIETQMEDAKTNAQAGLEQVEKANEHYGQGNCVIS